MLSIRGVPRGELVTPWPGGDRAGTALPSQRRLYHAVRSCQIHCCLHLECFGTRRRVPRQGHPPSSWCARHVVNLGGESFLRAVMSGTASRSKGVHREVGSEGSVRQNSDPTSRNQIEGWLRGVTEPWMGRPGSHLERWEGKSGGSRGKETRLTLGGLWICEGEPG